MSSGVNMLTDSLKILDTIKTEFFKLKSFEYDRKIFQRFCLEDLTSVSDTLTCWLFISVLTRDFLGIKVTTPFAIYNFADKSAMRLIFFFKMLKIDVESKNGGQNSESSLSFGDNCTFIGCVKNSILLRENSCHLQFTCYETVSRFQIPLRKNFSNSGYFKVIKKYDKTTAI